MYMRRISACQSAKERAEGIQPTPHSDSASFKFGWRAKTPLFIQPSMVVLPERAPVSDAPAPASWMSIGVIAFMNLGKSPFFIASLMSLGGLASRLALSLLIL